MLVLLLKIFWGKTGHVPRAAAVRRLFLRPRKNVWAAGIGEATGIPLGELLLTRRWGLEVFWCHQNIPVIRKSSGIPKYSDCWRANESHLARCERL